MPLPANVSVCTITGKFTDADGTAAVGSVTFVPVPVILLDPSATPPTSIVSVPIIATLNVTGEIPAAFTIPATDDGDLNPVSWTYKVIISTDYYKPEPFFLNAPGGNTIDLCSVIPAAEFGGYESVVVAPASIADDIEEVLVHTSLTTTAHGGIVASTDPRLTNARTPTGAAGGVLTGTYPNPTFAADMATQTELDAVAAAKANTSHTHAAADITSGTVATARLGSGTANTITYLRGDQTWVVPPGLTDGDKGDITVSGSGATWTIDAASVTAAKLASDVPELIRDTMATALVAGSNVTVTPNDAGDTITIAATGGGAGVTDGDKGDITVSGSGATWTIDAGAVTAAKVAADVATQAELDAHINDTTAAHAAASISYAGGTGISATDVEAAIDELATEKADVAHTHAAADINSGTIATARLGSGTADSTSFLRGDQTWVVPTASGGTAGHTSFVFNATTTAPPAATQLRMNNASQTAATTLWVHQNDFDNLDVTLGLNRIIAGTQIYLQDYDDSTKWIKYDVSAAVDSGAYFTYTIAYNSGPAGLPTGSGAAGRVELQQVAPNAIRVPDGDKGDITVSSSGSVWTIDNGAVTAAKLASDVPELIRDTIGATLDAGGNITIAPNDAGDLITLSVPASSATVVGAIELATQAEVNTGTDAVRAVTPVTLATKLTSEMPELIRDTMATALVAGANVTITPNDAGDTITIASAGSGGGGTVADGDYGDITVSGTGTAWAIDSGVVTNAKLSTIATNTIKGRRTASTGAVEDLTPANARLVLASDSGGGTTNFFAADGTWTAPPTGGVTDGDKGDITVTSSGATWTIDAGVVTAAKCAADVATQAELDAHVNDTTAAHAASAISYAGGTGMSATDVEAAIDELATEKANAAVAINTTAPLAGGGDLSTTRTLTIDAATATATGAIELATQLEVNTGTDAVRAVTPLTLHSKPKVKELWYSIPGTLTAAGGAIRIPFPRTCSIVNVAAVVNTAPTGASILVDVNKNGTTIFTTQSNRPTIAVSTNADNTASPDVSTVAANDYLTIDVDQIGSTVAGADLTVRIDYAETGT